MVKNIAKRSFKLDIMTVLEAIDKNDKSFYSNLTEEEKKGFIPKVIIRWLSSLPDNNPYKEYYLLATNDIVNINLWELNKHPELLYLLMTISGIGKKQYHSWIPTKSVTNEKTPNIEKLLRNIHPNCNDQEFKLLKSLYSAEEIIELAKLNGKDDKTIKEIKEETKHWVLL